MGEHLCPVCGKTTFSVHNSFEICHVCGWEDDGLQYKNPDLSGGANDDSLNDYRKKWQKRQADSKNRQ